MKTPKSAYLLPTGVLLFVSLLLSANLAQATMIHFQAELTGPGESPSNASPGTGFANVFLDDTAQTMEVQVSFTGLLGTATASHIHATTAFPDTGTSGVATETPTFGGFPLGVTAGSYDHMFDLTLAASFNPAFITANGGTVAGASAVLENAMLSDEAYLNIHTTKIPSGEIRGFLHVVPDSASTALLLTMALGGMAGFSRFRKIHA